MKSLPTVATLTVLPKAGVTPLAYRPVVLRAWLSSGLLPSALYRSITLPKPGTGVSSAVPLKLL
ncbi:hypothetical protein D3C85_1113370 [compost metagenome]